MPYVETAIPSVGTPVRRSLIKAIIGNISYIFSAISGIIGSGTAPNGSFEIDSNADGVPDEWSYTAGAGAGTGVLDTTDTAHGGKSFKFTRLLGSGNSGGTLETTDYFEVTPNRQVTAQWQMKCSAAGVRVKVELRFFTRAKVFISSSEIYNSTSNPTSWTHKSGAANPPSNAYYAKLKITGGDTSPNVAGTTAFDDLSVYSTPAKAPRQTVFTASSTWQPPQGVLSARIRCYGGGGGGAAGSGGVGGGGGGGGGFGEITITVDPNTNYTVTVGSGGSGGVSGGAAATAGGTSSVGALLSVTGGAAGTVGGAGGNGGTGGGDFSVNGQGGESFSGTSGGDGGIAGGGAPNGRKGASPTNGRPGGGGGGGGNNGANGGQGGDGRVIIEW